MMRTLVMLLLLSPATAFAGGINFAWNACLNEGGVGLVSSSCSSNLGSLVAVGSFALTAPQPNFTNAEVILDIYFATPTTPSWWQVFNAGSCRQTAASVNFLFQGHPNEACVDPWSGQAAGGIGAYLPGHNGDPNKARLIAGGAVPTARALEADLEYYGFQLVLSHANTVGPGACEGCGLGACILMQEIRVMQADGSFERCNSPLQGQGVVWQCGSAGGGHVIGCSFTRCSTPSAATSWGQIKGLYR